MSVLGLLGVCFVVMKILGLIDWSWWLVTLPFWGGAAAAAAIVVAHFVIAFLKARRKINHE